MKTKLLVFLVGVLMLGAANVRAAEVIVDGLRYMLSEDGRLTAEITICYELTGSALVIPDCVPYDEKKYTVVSIGESAFSGQRGLTSVKLPSGLTSIGKRVFFGCSGLTSLTLPSGVTSIGTSAFAYCYDLTSVTLSSGLTSIEGSAFYYCIGLTSVTLPSSLTSIGMNAFFRCRGLTSITLPSGLTSIEGSAFTDCSGLTSIRCAAPVPPEIYSYTFDPSHYAGTLYIPVGSKVAYMADSNWGKFRYIIEDNAEVSVNELPQSDLITYANGILTLPDTGTPATVTVYTTEGKQVAFHQVAGGSCDLNALASGVYIIKVFSGGKVMSRKIVK